MTKSKQLEVVLRFIASQSLNDDFVGWLEAEDLDPQDFAIKEEQEEQDDYEDSWDE